MTVVRRVDLDNALECAAVNSMIDEVEAEQDWRFVDRCHPGKVLWWVALVGKDAAGFAALTPGDDYGYLSAAAVLRKFRGRGIQRKLIKARIDEARRRKWDRVVSYTYNDNVASANSLIDCGFRRFAPARPWDNPKLVQYWRLPLKP